MSHIEPPEFTVEQSALKLRGYILYSCPAGRRQNARLRNLDRIMQEIESLRAQVEQNRPTPPDAPTTQSGGWTDAQRLMFIVKGSGLEGFANVDRDCHDFACDVANENGREEADLDDELEGFRRLIDAAIEADIDAAPDAGGGAR